MRVCEGRNRRVCEDGYERVDMRVDMRGGERVGKRVF